MAKILDRRRGRPRLFAALITQKPMVSETKNHRLRERKTEGSEKRNLSISISIRISISIEKRKYKEKSPRPENRKPESGKMDGWKSCRLFYAGSVPQNGEKYLQKRKFLLSCMQDRGERIRHAPEEQEDR
jgi:hypothetical protein